MKFIKIFLFFFTYSFLSSEELNIKEFNFLIGNFDPSKEPNFIEISSIGIPTKGKKLFLQKEVAFALLKMYKKLKEELPNVEFWVVSATRTFAEQKIIWENKWNKYEKESLNQKSIDEIIAKKILQYSSMPSTSRHHWGTDFDINVLVNSYYSDGNGKKLYEWLIQNTKQFGFFNPYNSGRKNGYLEEKWHWSYYPLASQYLKRWNYYYSKNQFQIPDFKGSHLYKKFAYTYVNEINPAYKID